jgi:hypothetical protein
MEVCPECRCDSIEVFDGYSESSRSLGKFCSRSWQLTSSGQYLFVKFKSDVSGNGSAFTAGYQRLAIGKVILLKIRLLGDLPCKRELIRR